MTVAQALIVVLVRTHTAPSVSTKKCPIPVIVLSLQKRKVSLLIRLSLHFSLLRCAHHFEQGRVFVLFCIARRCNCSYWHLASGSAFTETNIGSEVSRGKPLYAIASKDRRKSNTVREAWSWDEAQWHCGHVGTHSPFKTNRNMSSKKRKKTKRTSLLGANFFRGDFSWRPC